MTRAGYAAAGVDIAAADRAVELIRAAVGRTARPEVVGGIGGFAGLFDASRLAAYRRPLLATSTDGVGTKVMIAARLRQFGTIGIDLVAMVADDLVACGAEPLFIRRTSTSPGLPRASSKPTNCLGLTGCAAAMW